MTPMDRPWRVERVTALRDAGIWIAVDAGSDPDDAEVRKWLPEAERIFLERSEVASLRAQDAGGHPVYFINGEVSDLIGWDAAAEASPAGLNRWLDAATAKGLQHYALPMREARPQPPAPRLSSGSGEPMSIGIDAEWLLGGESGAQVFVFEMLKELARRPAVSRIVLLSDSGAVPGALAGVARIGGMTWAEPLASVAPLVDVLHRPYQPGVNVDFRRYRKAGRCVALTILDFIAYDIPGYHESDWAWRRYREAFDEQVALADGVFAISAYVGDRLQRQIDDRAVGVVLLGTDHLEPVIPGSGGAAAREIGGGGFLLVLGNDFTHKNRDFAVKVFRTLRDRGYGGKLVLAGFHLDLGSSYGYELEGAGPYADQVVRIGAVSSADKTWLLYSADAVLYPTSCEGFGLVPFEAAAAGTPTAFVKFGPLAETMPGVDAAPGWRVGPFADFVERLLGNREHQVAQIRAAGAPLTWAAHVDRIVAGYRALLDDEALPARRRPAAGASSRALRAINSLNYHLTSKLRRLVGGNGHGEH